MCVVSIDLKVWRISILMTWWARNWKICVNRGLGIDQEISEVKCGSSDLPSLSREALSSSSS